MSYKAYLKQEGEGCDYTIGCGKTIIHLKSITLGSAMNELSEIIADEYNHDDSRLKRVILYEISNTMEVDIDRLYEYLSLMEKAANSKLKDNVERAEYERLKLKFK